MKYNEKKLGTITNKFLKKNLDWNEDLAIEIATNEGIKLTKQHWQIIYFLRSFYFSYNILPTVRIIIKNMRKINKKNDYDSISLFNLFPVSPIRKATKIAGLDESISCL